jgi:hypothetical protein
VATNKGGGQERDAVVSMVKEAFPDAIVETTLHQTYPNSVAIDHNGHRIVEVPQRDLYRKYGWPAQVPIKAALSAVAKQ